MRRRRSLRLRNHDYRQNAAYFVTICTHKAECLFGDVVDGEIILSTLGNIANDEWLQTAKVRSYVELDAYVVMPNMLVWQRGYYDSILQSEHILHDVRSYIAANP